MKDLFIKWFMAFNKWLIQISHGRFGSQLGKQKVLILHTTGRKSGEDRAIPIAYFTMDKSFLIVGSNWGKEQHANWVLNLRTNPQAILEIKGQKINVLAHEAEGEEYTRLWDFVTEIYPLYLDYQEMTTRHIPIMVFEEVGA